MTADLPLKLVSVKQTPRGVNGSDGVETWQLRIGFGVDFHACCA